MPFDNLKRPGPQRGAGERAINLPPAILWLIAINVVVHVLRQPLSEQADQQLILNLGLIPENITGDQGSLLSLASLVTYQFLHGSWVHLGVNMLSLAAFGAPVERLLGVRRFVLFYLSAGIVSGLVHVLLSSDTSSPVIGASGAISGVFGAVLILMRQVGSLSSVLPIAVIWIAMNVFFGFVGGTPGAEGEPVAWMAHVGGFIYGLAAIRLFVPRGAPPS
jgi:membrane associated rhomboid family serine protease